MKSVPAKTFAGNRSSNSILSVKDLYKTFTAPSGERIEVLRGISFSASAGEAVAIIGASGAGKTTLLQLLGGLEAADSGAINVDGLELDRLDSPRISALRNRKIGFVFQFHHLLPDLSALENVALPLMIAGLGRQESQDRARISLVDLGLGSRADHKISYLSGGEQQRIAVLRALITEPLLVLADEPTGNLDKVIENDISSQLVAFARKRRRTLVVATHNERLAELCDRVLILEKGHLNELRTADT
jgi:lipoprotein-releasing system ATP-binding protein